MGWGGKDPLTGPVRGLTSRGLRDVTTSSVGSRSGAGFDSGERSQSLHLLTDSGELDVDRNLGLVPLSRRVVPVTGVSGLKTRLDPSQGPNRPNPESSLTPSRAQSHQGGRTSSREPPVRSQDEDP